MIGTSQWPSFSSMHMASQGWMVTMLASLPTGRQVLKAFAGNTQPVGLGSRWSTPNFYRLILKLTKCGDPLLSTYFWPHGWAIAVACWIEQIHQEQGQFLHWHLCRHCQNSNAYNVVAPVPSWIHAIDCRYIYICTNRKPIVSLCFHLWHCLETK